MSRIQKEKDNRSTLTWSNALIQAAHGLTLDEKMVILLGATKINQFADAEDDVEVLMTVQEFMDFFDVSRSTAYRALNEGIQSIFGKLIKFKDKETGEIVLAHWLTKARFKEGDYYRIRFSRDVIPHMVALKERFTILKIETFRRLKNVYAWRLAELILQYANMPKDKSGSLTRVFLIEDLLFMLDAPESCRERPSLLITRVIRPATDEINNKTNLVVRFDVVKGGRILDKLKMTVKNLDDVRLDNEISRNAGQEQEKKEFSESQLRAILKNLAGKAGSNAIDVDSLMGALAAAHKSGVERAAVAIEAEVDAGVKTELTAKEKKILKMRNELIVE